MVSTWVTMLELRPGYKPFTARLAAFNKKRIFVCCVAKVHVVVSKRLLISIFILNTQHGMCIRYVRCKHIVLSNTGPICRKP
jgi:hypothetical protein